MEIKIDNLLMGGTSAYKIQAPVSGLGKPPIRMAYGAYSGRDGGYVSSQFYSPREIVINGFYIGANCDNAQALRDDLLAGLKLREILPVYITTFNGVQYLVEAYVRDLKMDIIDDKSGVYQIALVAPDPYLYDAGDGVDPESGYVTATITKAVGGGYVFPYVLPVTWQASSQYTTVTNSNSILLYPQIILTGKFTNPRITNMTTGEFIELETVTGVQDTIVIDMKYREITLNGGSIAGYRTEDSTWWGLESGDNIISLETDDPSDAMTGIIRWRQAYEGI